MYKSYSMELAGRTLTVDIGRVIDVLLGRRAWRCRCSICGWYDGGHLR